MTSLKKKITSLAAAGAVAALAVVPLATPVSAVYCDGTAEVTGTDKACQTVEVLVGSAITINVNNAKATIMGGSGFAESSVQTVTVVTNNATGYTATLKMATVSTNLVNAASNTLATSAAVASTPNTWGVKIGSGSYAAMPASSGTALDLLSGTPVTGPSAALGDTYSVTYGANTTSATPSGTYEGEVVYTAVANP